MTAAQTVHDILIMLLVGGFGLGGAWLGYYMSRRP